MRQHSMYPDTRRGSTGSHLGETDKDRKMRQVGDSNRRVERQLVRHLKEIDQHLQVNLKQMSGNYEMKSASVSPPLSSPSPKYLASSSESMDDPNGNSPRSQRLHRPADPGHKSQLRKHKQQGTVQRLSESQAKRDVDNQLMPPREKTFTIIDHGILTDSEGATDDYNEAKSRIKTLDVHDRERLLRGTNGKIRQANNLRNDKVNNYVSTSKKNPNRSELTSNRALNVSLKVSDISGKNTTLAHPKYLGNTMDKNNQIQVVMSPKEISDKEQEVFSFNSNEIIIGSDKIRHLQSSKIPTAQNGGQILALDELNRRQLRKMNILSNLNKKHLRDPSEDDMFLRREKDLRVGRKFSHVPAPPQRLYHANGSVDAEKPRPKSAMFSSQRKPCFTSLDDGDSVFLDDLDIIDIDDDGDSSSDDDMLSSSFVAPLTSRSRHTLGLHTRSTSDISSSILHRSRDSQPQTSVINHSGQISNNPDLSKPNGIQKSAFDVSSKISTSRKTCPDGAIESGIGVNSPKHVQNSTTDHNEQLSPKGESVHLPISKDKFDTADKNLSNVKPDRGQGRGLPQFPRKLKPLFKPQNHNNFGNSDAQLELLEKEDVLPGISLYSKEDVLKPNTVQCTSSNLHQNKKLQRGRQKTWTPGIGAINNRDILKRPLGSLTNYARQRHKPDARTAPRRRARTSSELKKCSSKELESLKSGEVDSVETHNVLDNEQTSTPNLDLSDGLRSCRYLRNNTDIDSLSTVNVESF